MIAGKWIRGIGFRAFKCELDLEPMCETEAVNASQEAHPSPDATGDLTRVDRVISCLVVRHYADMCKT